MGEVEPCKVVTAMKVLVSPTTVTQGENKFDDFLETNMLELQSQLQTNYEDLIDILGAYSSASEETDMRWRFVVWNLKLLSALTRSMCEALRKHKLNEKDSSRSKPNDVPSLSPDVLSFTQQKTVATSVQLVVCLGIYPGLHPGVGVPIERRSAYGGLLSCDGPSSEVGERRLLQCLLVLLRCVGEQSTLSDLILPRHLSDLLATLCQLCYGPRTDATCASSSSDPVDRQKMDSSSSIKVQTDDIDKSESGNERVEFGAGNGSAPSQCAKRLSSEHSMQVVNEENAGTIAFDSGTLVGVLPLDTDERLRWCKQELQRLVDEAHPSLLIRELLILQGGPSHKGTGAKAVRCPAWLRKASGCLLAQQLARPGGVRHLFIAMLQDQPDSVDWRKCDAIAQIITRCPRQVTAVEYYRQVAPQLFEILHTMGHQNSPEHLCMAVSTIVAMTSRNKDAAQRWLIDPLLDPLLRCTEGSQIRGELMAGEEELLRCILDIHKVFIAGSEPHACLLSALQPIIHVLFRLHCFIRSGVSQLRRPVENILVAFLRQSDHQVALAFLQLMAFGDVHDRPTDISCVRMSDRVDFSSAATGGVVATTRCSSLTDKPFNVENWQRSCDCIVDLLKQLNRDGLAAEFFLFLLKDLTSIVSEEASSGIQLPTGGRNDVGRNLEVLGLLASLSEQLGHACFTSTQHILQFAQVTLERGVKVLEHTSDDTVGVFETETLTMAMGLLTAVLSHPENLTSADRDQTKTLLPLLQHIAADHSDPSVREMATDLRIAIATHGIVLSELAKKRTTDGACRETKQRVGSVLRNCESSRSEVKTLTDEILGGEKSGEERSAPLIEVLSSHDNDDDTETTSNDNNGSSVSRNIDTETTSKHTDKTHTISSKHTDKTDEISSKQTDKTHKISSKHTDKTDEISSKQTDKTHKISSKHTDKTEKTSSTHITGDPTSGDASSFEQALVELCDSLVPVRGHGLITLTRLLRRRDAAALSRTDLLMMIFRENLAHPDTYIYLQAVAGLSALGEVEPGRVLPALLGEYSQGGRAAETRLKLGEAIVRISRSLGDMIPAYRDALVGALLCGVRDTDPLVRASCLSNLGDVCKLLRFSIRSVIHEMFACISSLLKTDPDSEVRKAAAMFLTLLLQGVGTDTMQVLEPVLRDLYRLLKLVSSSESDQMVKVHVQLALAELDTVTRGFLFPQQSLTKKISILHP